MKKSISKRTDFSCSQLIDLVKTRAGGPFPSCLYVNDLVAFFWDGDKMAGEFLCEILSDPRSSEKEKYPAYIGLASVSDPGEDILRSLVEFQSESNKPLIESAQEHIRELKDQSAQ